MTFDEYRARCESIRDSARILVATFGYTGAARRTGLQAATIRRALKRPGNTQRPTAARLHKIAAQTRQGYELAKARHLEELRREQEARDRRYEIERATDTASVISAIANASAGRVVMLAEVRTRKSQYHSLSSRPRGPKNAA